MNSIETIGDRIDFDKILAEAHVKFSRSGGKGGQNVNKVETKVELSFNVMNSHVLSQEVKEQLLRTLSSKLDHENNIHVVSSKERSQHANRKNAEELLIALIKKGLVVKKKRTPTKPSKAVKLKRLQSKRKISEKKRSRQTYED